MYLMCAQNMCAKKKNTKNKSCYNKIDNGWDETKQNQGKPEPGVAGALGVGVPGPPPRATPGVLLHNRLDWQGLVLGVSR